MRGRRVISALLAVLMLLSLCGCVDEQPEAQNVPTVISDESASDVSAADSDTSSPDNTDTANAADTAAETLSALRAEAAANGAVCAAAVVGFGEPAADIVSASADGIALTAKYPFINDIPESGYIELEGWEVYCIIPTDPQASVRVNRFVMDESNDYAGGAGDELYSSATGEPFILRGNVSDIMPSFIVTITDSAGRSLEYSPYMSLRDGSFVTVDGVYDFTVMELPESEE